VNVIDHFSRFRAILLKKCDWIRSKGATTIRNVFHVVPASEIIEDVVRIPRGFVNLDEVSGTFTFVV